MTQPTCWIILAMTLLVPLSTALAQDNEIGVATKSSANEIGTPASSSQPIVLNELSPELDFSFTYHHLTNFDLNKTYSFLPQLGVGISFQTTQNLRTFFSLRYGQRSGSPFHDLEGFDSEPEVTIKTVPFHVGMKYNLAQSSRFRVYAGFAFILAWTREEVPPQLDHDGNLDSSPASELTTGYMITFAPEWVLGQGSNSLGLEVGFGGTMGTLYGETHSHEVDLTGYSGRVYFVLGL